MRTVTTLKPSRKGDQGTALSRTRSRLPSGAEARRPPGRGRCNRAVGGADRLVGEERAAAGEVRRRPVGPGQAGLDAPARRGRAPRPPCSGGRWRWLDIGTWWLDVGTASLVRGGWMWAGAAGWVAVPRCGHRCLDVGTSGCVVSRCRNQVPRCRNRVTVKQRICADDGSD